MNYRQKVISFLLEAVLARIPFLNSRRKRFWENLKGQNSVPKIFHVTNAFSLKSETFIYDLIVGLEKSGNYNNYVLCKYRALKKERHFEKVLVDFDRIYNFIFKSNSNSIVHFHFGWSAVRYVSIFGIPPSRGVVISFHGADVSQIKRSRKSGKKYVGFLNYLAKSEKVIFTTPSEQLKNQLLSKINVFPEKIIVTGNKYNLAFLNCKKDDFWQKGKKFRIISVGRLVEMKGHKYLIESIHSLKKVYPNIELTIIGEGPLKQEYTDLINSLNLQSEVVLYGYCSHHLLPKLFNNSDLFVMPSVRAKSTGHEESFGVALAEAIVAGLPVVYTDLPAFEEIFPFTDLKVRMVPQYSASAITDAIVALMSDPQNFSLKGGKLQTYVVENYSESAIMKKFDEIYGSLNLKTYGEE